MPTDETLGPAYDFHFMDVALRLAARALGTTAPNPAVGCLIVREGEGGPRVIARGATAKGGRPHAETVALARAGEGARGATAYVSLEPCAHRGATPPCVRALIEAGITRAVVAATDPDPRVSGRGLAALREAKIALRVGVHETEARRLNAGFFLCATEGRPLVTLKIASSLDGRIATHSGESRWITSEGARRAAHALRAQHDAVMVGSATALMDDPELLCRLPGLEDRLPVRIVADGRLRLPLTGRLVREARHTPVWVLTRADSDRTRRQALEQCGVTLIDVPVDGDQALNLSAAMRLLGARGLTRLLVEGGSRLTGALIRARLVDRVAWFHSNLVLGADGTPAVSGFGLKTLAEAPRFRLLSNAQVGEDVLDIYEAQP
jgi:diaminohydroxyphosphoribosylaminopyrimidine deaminase/5-amino-6-(5-phosphoribosylamino)uracil reductase